MSSSAPAKEENWRRELKKAQQGDKETRDRLVTENMGLVHMAARRFYGRGVDPEELVQIGTIGLITAIDRFDCGQPYCFSTYAVPMIVGEIRRFLRNDGMVHISRQIKENARKIAIVRENIEKTENREPTVEELGRAAGLSQEELLMAMEASAPVESISKPAGEDASVTMQDTLADNSRFEVQLLDHLAVGQALNKLDKSERHLVELRYQQNRTQAETAACLGMSQAAVSRLEKKVLGKLRRMMN